MKPISVQLYSVRQLAAEDFFGTLKKVADIGYKGVELASLHDHKASEVKKVISDLATTGVYYWTRGSDFVKYAQDMIAADRRVNGEFYVAPVYNEAVADGKKVRVVHADRFHCLGTPEHLAAYIARHDA